MRDKVLGPRFVQNAFDSSAEATSCEAWTVWVRHMKRSSSKVTDISIGSFLHDSPCTVFPGKALKKYVLLQTTAGMECIFAQTVNFVNMDRRQLLVVPIKSWKTKSESILYFKALYTLYSLVFMWQNDLSSSDNKRPVNTRPNPLTASTGKRSKVTDQESVDGRRQINQIHVLHQRPA